MQLTGLHHVTCVCSNAQQTLDFYRQIGFSLVKKTVNFDDPHSYHLYFGDEVGNPVHGQPVDRAVFYAVSEPNVHFFCADPTGFFGAALAAPLDSGNFVVKGG